MQELDSLKGCHKLCITPRILYLIKGEQYMILKNDTCHIKKYYNGEIIR
jgi:hypothetical protein